MNNIFSCKEIFYEISLDEAGFWNLVNLLIKSEFTTDRSSDDKSNKSTSVISNSKI